MGANSESLVLAAGTALFPNLGRGSSSGNVLYVWGLDLSFTQLTTQHVIIFELLLMDCTMEVARRHVLPLLVWTLD